MIHFYPEDGNFKAATKVRLLSKPPIILCMMLPGPSLRTLPPCGPFCVGARWNAVTHGPGSPLPTFPGRLWGCHFASWISRDGWHHIYPYYPYIFNDVLPLLFSSYEDGSQTLDHWALPTMAKKCWEQKSAKNWALEVFRLGQWILWSLFVDLVVMTLSRTWAKNRKNALLQLNHQRHIGSPCHRENHLFVSSDSDNIKGEQMPW